MIELCYENIALVFKNNLLSSAFSLKFVINLFSRNRGGIQGYFYYYKLVAG